MKIALEERPKPVNGTVGDARCTFTCDNCVQSSLVAV